MSHAAESNAAEPVIIGRYALFDELAAGGMATVHLARLLAAGGEARTVAIKRLHAQYAKDPEFCAMFMDETRLVSRIRHRNVVQTVDVVHDDGGLYLVMEYVHGESLSRLMRVARRDEEAIPPMLIATILHDVLLGLHAAHDTTGADGHLLGVVHRDVSPQNIIVGTDGVSKVLDFGIAKAAGRLQTTREGQIKGKLAYMAPEQIRGTVDRRTDVFAAAVVLWEALAGRRLHEGMRDVEIVTRIVQGKFEAPSTHAPGVPPELDAIVLKGLASDPKRRFSSALEMAEELEKLGLVERAAVSAWVERLAHDTLSARALKVSAIEAAARAYLPSTSAVRQVTKTTDDLPTVGDDDPDGEHATVALRIQPYPSPPAAPPQLALAPVLGGAAPLASPATSTPGAAIHAGAPLQADTAPLPPANVEPPAVAPLGPMHAAAGGETPFGERPLRRGLVLAICAVSLLLALVGIGLGSVAVAQRGRTSGRADPTASSSAQASPRPVSPAVPSSAAPAAAAAPASAAPESASAAPSSAP